MAYPAFSDFFDLYQDGFRHNQPYWPPDRKSCYHYYRKQSKPLSGVVNVGRVDDVKTKSGHGRQEMIRRRSPARGKEKKRAQFEKYGAGALAFYLPSTCRSFVLFFSVLSVRYTPSPPKNRQSHTLSTIIFPVTI